jgi:hypothetical protein
MTDPNITIDQLLADRPPNWEYRLTTLWLREGFAGVDKQLVDLKRGAIFRQSTVLTTSGFSRWAQQKMDDLTALAGVVVAVLADDLTPACGNPRQPGNPARIRQAVDRLIEVGEHLIEWEIEVYFTHVDDDEVQAVKALMAGWAEDLLRQIETLPARLDEMVSQAAPGGSYELTLTFTPPATLNEATARLKRIGQTRATKASHWPAPFFMMLLAALVIGLALLCALAGGTG